MPTLVHTHSTSHVNNTVFRAMAVLKQPELRVKKSTFFISCSKILPKSRFHVKYGRNLRQTLGQIYGNDPSYNPVKYTYIALFYAIVLKIVECNKL